MAAIYIQLIFYNEQELRNFVELQATQQIFIEHQIENVEIWKSLPWFCKLYSKHANGLGSFEWISQPSFLTP